MIDEIKFIEYNGIEGYIELMKHDVEPLNNPECKRIELLYDGKDIKAVLDYITNLQEKYDIAQKDIEVLSNNYNDLVKMSENKITNLQEENEKLKQPQIFIDTMDMEERYGQELYEDYLKEQLEDYKSRNEKAIEFIKEKISSTQGVINDYMYHKEHNKILIELLKEDIEMYKKELHILNGGDE